MQSQPAEADVGAPGAAGQQPADAPSYDAAAPSQAGTPCGAPGIFLCDDFESAVVGAQPDAARWTPAEAWKVQQGAAPLVDDTRAHSGTRSVSVTGQSVGAFMVSASGFPAQDNRFYVRAWLQLEKATSEMGGHVGFIVAADLPSNGEELRLGASHGMVDLNLIPGSLGENASGEVTRFSNGDTTGGDLDGGPGIVLDAETWYCIEALFDGGGDEFRMWLDGAEVSQMHVTDWKPRETSPARRGWAPPFNHAKVGAQNYSGQAGTVWYDDVAFGSQRIGCNPG